MVRTPYSVSVADGREGRNNYARIIFRQHAPSGASGRIRPGGLHLCVSGCARRFESEGKFVRCTHTWMRKNPRPTWTRAATCTTPSSGCSKTSPNNNGKVGIWGISYPGFYTAASIIDSHPAIKAASPQAPMINLFGRGDDAYHGGAFMLAANFSFYSRVQVRRTTPPPNRASGPSSTGARTTATSSSSRHGTFA